MINSFNTNVATKFGINVALFIQHLAQWTFKNLPNKRNINDGYCWSYDSLQALKKIFPYWTKSQIETAINNAEEAGLLKKGNYNTHKYDRTCWYALSYMAYEFYVELQDWDFAETLYSSISEKSEMDLSYFGNGVLKIRTPIPTNKPTNKNITKVISKNISDLPANEKAYSKTMELMRSDNPFEIEDEVLEDFEVVRKSKKAPITKTAWKGLLAELSKCRQQGLNPHTCFIAMVTNGWQSLKAEWFISKETKKNADEIFYIEALPC